MRINEDQRDRFLKEVRSALVDASAASVSASSASPSRAGTDDIRESPAILIVQALMQEGCKITAYDPAAMDRTQEVMNSNLKYAGSAYEAGYRRRRLADPSPSGKSLPISISAASTMNSNIHRDRRPQPV